ncbi:helix-turn-helix transcriptional regulator [Fictibacillus sp. S7]|uniref:helix-turn-helix transcriptional regulator n=1 Tax=Fictibacillus sp. S7 TaxID=2212476 RepID=UPI0010109145|nr:helix-turn-helix transcriptional regulator [Fictibacillus sp. S7]RXZ00855.1 transcriptional regulator [Fictibacillus sp. S7]
MNSNNLKDVRTERGISISELARRSHLSRVTVTDIESGRRNPTIKTVTALCKALNKEPSEIFFLESV